MYYSTLMAPSYTSIMSLESSLLPALSHAVVHLQHTKGQSLSHHVYVVSQVKEPLLR